MYSTARQQRFVDAALALSKLVAFPLLVAATALLFIDDIHHLHRVQRSINLYGEKIAVAGAGWFLLTQLWSPLDGEKQKRVPASFMRLLALVVLACATGRLLLSARDPHNYPYLSVLHWSKELLIVLIAVDECLRLDKHQRTRTGVPTTPLDFVNSPLIDDTSCCLHALGLLLAFAFGFAMTMPFMAHDDGFPAALGTNETIIVWWAPFEQPR
mmetsp:Transcript_15994/g.41203  ORF Transcript_15994/g.41203 Transcript_15994/m.41203 type:complete len:213 (-) Transcript_15994:5-643(-)